MQFHFNFQKDQIPFTSTSPFQCSGIKLQKSRYIFYIQYYYHYFLERFVLYFNLIDPLIRLQLNNTNLYHPSNINQLMNCSKNEPQNIQFQYDTFNHLKIIQSIKDITKFRELKKYEKNHIRQILQANIEQAYFMFLSHQYGLKVYKQKDLFFSPQGNIVFLSFSSLSYQKLAKLMIEVNTQNLISMLQQLKKKMVEKLKDMQCIQFSFLNQWEIPIDYKNTQLQLTKIFNSEIYNNLKELRIFQKYSLRARVQGSILVRKLNLLSAQDIFYIKTHFLQYSQIIEGCYSSIAQKQKQKSTKLNQILSDLVKCGILKDLKVIQGGKQKFHQTKLHKQIAYFNQSFIICIQICNCQLEQIKRSYRIQQQQLQQQFYKESQLPKFAQKQKKYFTLCFTNSNTIQVKLETSWKISEAIFFTQFKKKIRDLVQRVNQSFLTNSKTEPIEHRQFDIEQDKTTSKIHLIQKVTIQKRQLGLFTLIKVVDQLIILYLALVKIALYYQILSFDYFQRYSFSEPTQREQSRIVKNIYGYWGILSQKYESLKRYCLQQNVTTNK